jgi:rare lipoprotein A
MKPLALSTVLLLVLFCSAEAATVGRASYYGAGGRTSNGERAGRFTAAHRTLPFGTRVRVTNQKNNRSVTVRINDRGPFAQGRMIDVSAPAARALGFRSKGVAQVKVEQMGKR